MNKLKKAAAVAVMVGGLGLVGGGVASASGGHGYDGPFPDVAIDNLQTVDCDQEYDGGTAAVPGTLATVGGDNETNVGNFCTVIGTIGD